VTPEITYLPAGMGNMANGLSAKAGGLADVSASLVSALFELGADVHVALPHYRQMFHMDVHRLIDKELLLYQRKLSNSRIHLAEDRIFYYRDEVYGGYDLENPKIALAFQREVINNIIPSVQPDLIHCNDWMTGLIPAMARRLSIPCLFTVHNIHTTKVTMETVEDNGIDAAEFWRYLYYSSVPSNYECTRSCVPVDMLTSGIFAAHFINTVSPTFLDEIVQGEHAFVPPHIRHEFAQKKKAGCACGILNAPDPVFDPEVDERLECQYTAADHVEGKLANKRAFQAKLGLADSPSAPLLFWPSRLDPVQKGPQLVTEILYGLISDYWDTGLQVAVVANGAYQKHFRDVVRHHDFYQRVAVCDFDEDLSHLGYAAADYMLMPSLFEPCGLPQMISAIYGTLPIVHDTGGLHDTVSQIDVDKNEGNGFVFNVFDANGLRWAIDQAMAFHGLPGEDRVAQVHRVMKEGRECFNHSVTARAYFDIYESMLKRPLVNTF